MTLQNNSIPHTSTNLHKHQCKQNFAQNSIKHFHDSLITLLREIEPTRILSAGCGEGFDLKSIHDRGNFGPISLIGLDLNFPALRTAQDILKESNFAATNGNIYNLPFCLSAFDAILCLEVLEHLEQPERVLENILNQYTGYCIFSVPNEPFFQLTRLVIARKNLRQLGNHPEHLNRWSKNQFIRLISKYFTIDQVSTPYPWTMVLCH